MNRDSKYLKGNFKQTLKVLIDQSLILKCISVFLFPILIEGNVCGGKMRV